MTFNFYKYNHCFKFNWCFVYIFHFRFHFARKRPRDIGVFVSFIFSTNSLNVLRAIDTFVELWLYWEMAKMVIISTSDAYLLYRQWNAAFFAMTVKRGKSMLIGIFIFIVYIYTLYYREILESQMKWHTTTVSSFATIVKAYLCTHKNIIESSR